jgi:hypothetical protein
LNHQDTEIPTRDDIMDNSIELQNFDDYFDGMKDAVQKQKDINEDLNKFEMDGELHTKGIQNVNADQFELMNNRRRLVHTQPFTDS